MIEFKKIPTKPLEGWAAHAQLTAGTVQSVSEAQRNHHEAQLAAAAPTPALKKILDEQAALAKKQADLNTRQAEQVALIAQWDSKISNLERAQAELNIGVEKFDCLNGDVAGRQDFINTQAWPTNSGPHTNLSGIVQLYIQLAGVQKMVDDFPRWRTAKEAEVASIKADLTAFAELYKITPGK